MMDAISSFSQPANRLCAMRKARSRGFTLIELVMAMGMVAVLAVSLYASLNIAFRTTRTAEAAIEPSRTIALVMNLLGQDIENALPPSGVLAGNFEGVQGQEGDDLIFFSTADSAQHVDANGEIKQIELTVVTDAATNDHVLVRRVTRNLLSQNSPSPDEEILCRGVNSFKVLYFDGTNWTETWDSTQENSTAPAAVQIILELSRAVPSHDPRITRYTRIFNIACSTAAQDSTVNTGSSL
ncbi:MAG: prepilin-type N-terminal cleavage/methylation domain-containing protein [Planctomycetota bacterium]|nr:prepilin-type N-terminal cleavage/methylation domain-containing protein [Planctomycetota bacterium]